MKKPKNKTKQKTRPKLNKVIQKNYRPFKIDANIVHVFTDGSCWQGDKSGGWAAVLIYNEHKKEIHGGRPGTTNNQMELTAILEGLKAVKCRKTYKVVVYSDSQYCINAVTLWHNQWRRNGWRTAEGKPVKNKELIEEIVSLITEMVVFKWVKGHIGIEHNERADELAGQGRRLYGQG